ncbi:MULTISPECIES: transglycosylase SLT domain-containing protein [Streptococcus]|uniref:Lytic transglycosylase domain-containing protein n=1 Tax=Streptococcus vicugnae TaxID=2740579 RepID=A0A4R5G858_9STRE|nr:MULTISPECIES: transglycosylase SLT domain-containing protein [Streptococcus]MBJ7541732.1 transglycosylase SLT domain-containing protein [Streptococcus vicugnae]TDE75504.1 lytic transglycosylase domain-containing protein [Streptococcus vicugnae]
MYSRITKAKHRKIRNIIVSILGVIFVAAMIVVLIPKIEAFAETITTRSEAGAAKSVSTSSSESSDMSSTNISSTEAESEEPSSSVEESEEVESSSVEETSESEVASSESAPVTDATTVVATSSTVPSSTTQSSASTVVAANGNTAGAIGSAAAAQMAAATGVPQSTWEAIIARESNGDPNVANPSGASGLFQTMPGWGSTATVQDQITTAINVYNSQGLSAWGY